MALLRLMKLVILKNILSRYLNNFALSKQDQEIYKLWEEIITSKEIGNLKAHSHLLGIKRGYLEVEIDSSVALQEFFLRKEKIIQKLNKKIDTNKIKDIHFHLEIGRP